MGGDLDNSSKAIIGINLKSYEDIHVLIADPHLNSTKHVTKEFLIENEWIKWHKLNHYENSQSFYNYCIPQANGLYS